MPSPFALAFPLPLVLLPEVTVMLRPSISSYVILSARDTLSIEDLGNSDFAVVGRFDMESRLLGGAENRSDGFRRHGAPLTSDGWCNQLISGSIGFQMEFGLLPMLLPQVHIFDAKRLIKYWIKDRPTLKELLPFLGCHPQ